MNPFDLLISPAYAQAAPAPASPFASIAMFGVLLVVMYFMMIRPQMKRAKEHRAMTEKLAVGDEVITNGGIGGVVRSVGDAFVAVEVANGVELKVQKGAIANVLPKGTLKSAT